MAFRLIPREEKFYTDFQALATELKRGGRLLEEMLLPKDGPIILTLRRSPTRSRVTKRDSRAATREERSDVMPSRSLP
jgi:hypothetical protein